MKPGVTVKIHIDGIGTLTKTFAEDPVEALPS